MRFTTSLVASTAIALSLTSFASAHRDVHKRHAAYWARQAAAGNAPPAASSKPPTSTAPPASAPPASGAPPASTAPASSLPPPVSIPATAIPPLASIHMSAYIEGTMDIKKPFTPGATAPFSNAPPIPTGLPNPASYPALDTIPPINSPEVQEWLKQIDLTKIPNIKPTVDGSCDGDPAAAADKSRCWWTCGGCVRDTDISVCPDKNTWGVSYDDGPSPYTPKLLNYLDQKSIKATFFVVGSRVVSRPDMLRAEHIAGHEISVHTWSHHPLTTMTNEQIVAELGWTMKAIKDVVGVTPTTMRPPFGDIDDRVRAISMAMGLTPILWTGSGESEFDTDDWRIPGGTATGQSSFDQFNKILGLASSLNTGFIVLEHDLYQETVDMAVGYFLPSAETHNPPFKLEAINQCLGKSLADVYVETRTSTGNNSTKGGSGSGSGKGGSGSTNGTAGGSGNGAGAIAAPRYLAGIAVVAGVVGAGAILL